MVILRNETNISNCYFLFFFLATATNSLGQNTRIRDNNSIGWFTNTTTVHLPQNWGLHLEYQWRRTDLVRNWQQSLLRGGVNYKASPKVSLRSGWAWAQTFNYGDIPLQAAGKTFPEHRIFQMVQLTDKSKFTELTHRFMLEQRWVGRFSDPQLEKTDQTVYTNRMRYLFRAQRALQNKIEDLMLLYTTKY